MTSLERRVLKKGFRLKLATLQHGHLNMSTMGNQKKPSRSFLDATILLQVRRKTCACPFTQLQSVSICFPDFQMSDMPPQAGKPQPGVVKTQDPQIERDLHLSLDDLYLGCTKKIKISRRVVELWESSAPWAEEAGDRDTLDRLD